MKIYVVMRYWGIGEEVELDVISTNVEPGTEGWEELVDSFQDNFNCVLFVELSDKNRIELLSLKEKLIKPINRDAVNQANKQGC